MTTPTPASARRMTFGRYDYAAFCTYFAYAAASVVVPVALVLLARDLGFSLDAGGLTAGGTLQLGRSVPLVAAMLLCGFAAGHWGKRRTLGISVILMAAGIGLCAVAPAYGILLLALMVAGFGEGIIEGIGTPFVQDLHPDESGRYLNFSHSFWSVGVLVTVLVSGGLLSLGVSWRLVLGMVTLLSFVVAAQLLFPESPGRRYPEHPEPIHWTTTWARAVAIMRARRFWLFFAAMFVAGGGEFCLTFWCASFIQLNFGGSAWAGGVGTACFAAGMVLGRTGWGYLMSQHHLRPLIVWSALAGTAITLPFAWLTNLYVLFGLLFFAGVATAPFWPSVQSHCADRMPGSDTTMLFILLSCGGVPGCSVFTWLMGFIGNNFGGLRAAFFLVPASYLILAGLIAYDWWKSTTEARGPGSPSATATQA